jgi:hypothetical protein
VQWSDFRKGRDGSDGERTNYCEEVTRMDVEVRRSAERFWDSLTPVEKWQLGDDLVLGAFDWRDWLSSPPPIGFLSIVDHLRLLWEDGQ